MFVGHLGVGMAMKRADPEVNLGLLFVAALFLDCLLGIFVLAGLEQVHVAPDYRDLRDVTFTFPYSHSFLASLLWSALSFALVQLLLRRTARRTLAGLVVAVTVFSHWMLDLVVHSPELPLAGPGSPKAGLSLYGLPAAEAGLEVVLVVVGLVLYLRAASGIGRAATYALVGLMALLSLFTVAGALSGTPPAPTTAAVTWVLEAPLLGAIAFWIDRTRRKAGEMRRGSAHGRLS